MSPGMQRGVQMRRAGPARKGAFLAGASVLAIMIATGAATAAVFDFTGGEVEYTVPLTGLYDIVAAGAQGGVSADGRAGGDGAVVSGEFLLTQGEELYIYVGQKGGTGGDLAGGGGGGGASAVLTSTSPIAPLVVAGGGGGGGSGQYARGNPGLATTSGGAGGNYYSGGLLEGAGGVNGGGGGGGQNMKGSNGGGGAGLFGAGSNGLGSDSGLGGSWTAPGASLAPGGFRGGGGGGFDAGGGGGGYSGGGGGAGAIGHANGSGGGGGGGSYVAPSAIDVILESGVNSGDGSIAIARIPEPSTWVMTVAGFAGLAWLAARRRGRRARPA